MIRVSMRNIIRTKISYYIVLYFCPNVKGIFTKEYFCTDFGTAKQFMKKFIIFPFQTEKYMI